MRIQYSRLSDDTVKTFEISALENNDNRYSQALSYIMVNIFSFVTFFDLNYFGNGSLNSEGTARPLLDFSPWMGGIGLFKMFT